MEYVEANPLPTVCQDCKEPDCDVCDYGLDRWLLSSEEVAKLKTELLIRGFRRKTTADQSMTL